MEHRTRGRAPALAVVAALAALGCGDAASRPEAGDAGSGPSAADAGAPDAGPPNDGGPAPRTVFGDGRPATLHVPAAYAHGTPVPLLVVLHGYGARGEAQLAYLGLDRLVDEAGLLVVAPDGTLDGLQNRFWNATPQCCDFHGRAPDDVAYLVGLVQAVAAEYSVDRRRVYLFGHSNGGYMAYRLACERPDLFAAAVSLAGSTFAEEGECRPAHAVSVLQIHGDQDAIVRYDGAVADPVLGRHPGARETVERWGRYDRCTGALRDTGTTLDLVASLPGAETQVARVEGCPAGVAADLWTMRGGTHIPSPSPGFRALVWQWLAVRARAAR